MNELERSLRETAAQSPTRLAVQFKNRRLTYRELADALDALSGKAGFVAGMRVVLLLPDSIASYLCHLCFFQAGAVVVPVTVQATTANIKVLCDKVQPHFVVTNQLLRARHSSVFQDIPSLVVQSDQTEVPWGFDYEMVGTVRLPSRATRVSTTEPGDVRSIVFTSGSTGEPKGVCLGDSTILAAARMNVSFLSLSPARKSLATVPLYDYYGFIQIYSHLLARTGYIFGESIAFPDSLFQRIRHETVTDLVLVPHTLRKLLKVANEERRETLRAVQYMTSSSDMLTPELLREAFEVNPDLEIFNIYGLTEAGRACYRRIDASSAASSSIGRPAPNVTITIEGANGEPGEIVIRGPNVMRGYFQAIEDDRIAFKSCTEVRTGDLGYYGEHGEIILVGRRDHMFNINGMKVHPQEIERIALQVPGVADALARRYVDTNGEIGIYLDVVPHDRTCNLEEIHANMRKNLSPFFIPREIKIVDSLVRTELGSKVIRRIDHI